MFWQELWVDYLSNTRPSLTALGVPLVVLQMLCGLPPVLDLVHSVRRQNGFERVIVCLVPIILIVATAIVQPLFFSSFLGEGFSKVDELRQFLFQARFFAQNMVLCLVFYLLTLWRRRQEQKRLGASFGVGLFWASSGAELLAALCLLVLSTDYFLHGGGLFLAMPDFLVKWLVYGLFLVLYKIGVLLICLLMGLLFSERPGQNKTPAQQIAAGWRVKAVGWLMYAGLWQFAVVWGLQRDGSSCAWAQVIGGLLVGCALVCVLISLRRPKS